MSTIFLPMKGLTLGFQQKECAELMNIVKTRNSVAAISFETFFFSVFSSLLSLLPPPRTSAQLMDLFGRTQGCVLFGLTSSKAKVRGGRCKRQKVVVECKQKHQNRIFELNNWTELKLAVVMVVRNNRYALVPPCQFSTKILYYAPWAGSFAYLGCEPKLLFPGASFCENAPSLFVSAPRLYDTWRRNKSSLWIQKILLKPVLDCWQQLLLVGLSRVQSIE